jgi:hypothetical protein
MGAGGFADSASFGEAADPGNASRPFRPDGRPSESGKGRAELSQMILAFDQAAFRRLPVAARPKSPRPMSAAVEGSGTARNSVILIDPGPEDASVILTTSTSLKSTPAKLEKSRVRVPGVANMPGNTKGWVSEFALPSLTKTESAKAAEFETL